MPGFRQIYKTRASGPIILTIPEYVKDHDHFRQRIHAVWNAYWDYLDETQQPFDYLRWFARWQAVCRAHKYNVYGDKKWSAKMRGKRGFKARLAQLQAQGVNTIEWLAEKRKLGCAHAQEGRRRARAARQMEAVRLHREELRQDGITAQGAV